MAIFVTLCTPELKPGAVKFNTQNIISCLNKAKKADLVVFPRLCITGATCGSMYAFPTLVGATQAALEKIAASSPDKTAIVGLPVQKDDGVYDATAVVHDGKFELYCMPAGITDAGDNDILYGNDRVPKLHIGETTVSVLPDIPSGGDEELVIIPAAYPSYVGGLEEKLSRLIRLPAAAIVSSGNGESVSGRIMSGDKLVCISGKQEGYAGPDEETLTVKMGKIKHNSHDEVATRQISLEPLSGSECSEIYEIMGRGIIGRMREIGTDKVILGLSGGLDSANVLVAAVLAFEKYKLDKKNIICVTMRGGASSRRTQDNASALIEAFKVTGMNVPIDSAITLHMRAIEHDKKDVVFENAQARERTQILLDLSNKLGALMLGTGDLSEICLGWSTFGGDQLSQYNPNCSLTKTAIRKLLARYASQKSNKAAAKIIEDILATPISPELLSGQETESILGPYEVHDMFLRELIVLRHSSSEALKEAVKLGVDLDVAKKYLTTFVSRFFRYQFKRNFGPDGVKLFPYDLMGRTIRSDFSPELWLDDIDR